LTYTIAAGHVAGFGMAEKLSPEEVTRAINYLSSLSLPSNSHLMFLNCLANPVRELLDTGNTRDFFFFF
jgi:hypothetical protein